MRVTAVIPPKGRLVLFAWVGIPCALLAPFFFWQGLVNGLLFSGAAVLLIFAVYARAVSFVAAADGPLLRIFVGVLFPTLRRVPNASLCGAARIATPLLSLAGCRILILYTPSGTIFLPGLARQDAEALCAWARQSSGPAEEAP